MNNCTFSGRFVAAPRRHDSDTTPRCYFTVMVNSNKRKTDGSKYPAQAVDFVAWGKIAETICQYKDKGHGVVVISEFSTYERDAVDFNNKPIQNARKVNKPIFTVKEIEFMPVNTSNGQSSNNQKQYNQVGSMQDGNNNRFDSSTFSDESAFNIEADKDPFNIGDLP